MTRVVIYTDLDGSLLDHHSYSHAAADALLQELEQAAIPVVPCTSKTRAELLALRAELHNAHPFIAENGAAVFIPRGYFATRPPDTRERDAYWVKEFVAPRAHWLDVIATAGRDFAGRFAQFHGMSKRRIGELTGLDAAAAARAAAREFGEPVQWLGSDDERAAFIAQLQAHGARVLRGGRFLHVSGACDKGLALRWLNRQYAAPGEAGAPLSIAAGDSDNDIAMLEAADYALLIRSPAHPPPRLARTRQVFLSEAIGPHGWNEGVRRILNTITTHRG